MSAQPGWTLHPSYRRYYRDFRSETDGKWYRQYDNAQGPLVPVAAPVSSIPRTLPTPQQNVQYSSSRRPSAPPIKCAPASRPAQTLGTTIDDGPLRDPWGRGNQGPNPPEVPKQGEESGVPEQGENATSSADDNDNYVVKVASRANEGARTRPEAEYQRKKARANVEETKQWEVERDLSSQRERGQSGKAQRQGSHSSQSTTGQSRKPSFSQPSDKSNVKVLQGRLEKVNINQAIDSDDEESSSESQGGGQAYLSSVPKDDVRLEKENIDQPIESDADAGAATPLADTGSYPSSIGGDSGYASNLSPIDRTLTGPDSYQSPHEGPNIPGYPSPRIPFSSPRMPESGMHQPPYPGHQPYYLTKTTSTGGYTAGGYTTGGHTTGESTAGGYTTGGFTTGGYTTGGSTTGGYTTGGYTTGGYHSTVPSTQAESEATLSQGNYQENPAANPAHSQGLPAPNPAQSQGLPVLNPAHSQGLPAPNPAQSIAPEGLGGPGYLIKATTGPEGKLDRRFTRRSDAGNFFKIGRVFALLWHENAGTDGTVLSQRPGFSTGTYQETIYSSIRRMIVVRESRGCSWCIPISTYQGRGTLKPGLNPKSHAIVYMSDTNPQKFKKETGMTKEPLAVEPAKGQKLDPYSRVNFEKVYTVEHNVKVMDIGKVSRSSMPKLVGYWAKTHSE